MKILQIATLIPFPPTDGGKLSIFGLIKSLSERGHEIDFVCYRKDDDFEKSQDALKKFCNPHILDFQTDNTVKGAIKNLFSEVPYNASKYYSRIMLNYISDLIKRKEFDIIQINHLHLGWLSEHIKKTTNVPVVMRSQNIETSIMKRYSKQISNPFLKLYSRLQYIKMLKYELKMYSGFDLCIMISKNDLDYVKSNSSVINATYIPVGIDEKLLSFTKKDVIPHSIAHIGHTDWYPNYDSLKWFIREVFPKVLYKYSDATLYIYGGGGTHNFTIPADMRNNIKVMGFVDDLWASLSSIELSVVPLRIGGGIRVKILELLASGNLIVTTSVGKEGIGVRNQEHVLVADSSDAFAKQIIKIFDGYDASQIISDGRDFIIMNYGWKVIVEMFENAYKKLLEKHNKSTN